MLCLALACSLAAHAQTPTAALDTRDRNLYVNDPEAPGSLMKKGLTNVMLDQKDIWTSPFHLKKQNIKYLLIVGAATGALIGTDHIISRQLPSSGTSVDVGTDLSRTGQFYSVYPFAGALFLAGTAERIKSSETPARWESRP